MHLQKCLTFGVHIRKTGRLFLFVMKINVKVSVSSNNEYAKQEHSFCPMAGSAPCFMVVYYRFSMTIAATPSRMAIHFFHEICSPKMRREPMIAIMGPPPWTAG